MIRSDQALFPDRSQRSRRKSNRGGVASAPACTATSSALKKTGPAARGSSPIACLPRGDHRGVTLGKIKRDRDSRERNPIEERKRPCETETESNARARKMQLEKESA
ncbi:hypothetical protein NL676_031159 [Syzygium grande]|nr:hypothetical protein NL676_031159 [Syzygium grande]